MKKRQVYLDYAAASPMDPKVLKAMEPYFYREFYNPAAAYSKARKAKADINQAKSCIGSMMGIKPAEIVLTSGGTEGNNLAVLGVMEQFPDKKVLASAIEHESVIESANKYRCEEIPVSEDGIVELAKLKDMIDDDCVLVSVMQANNEVGTIQPLKQISMELDKVRRDRKRRNIDLPLIFHADACQAALYLDINPHRLGVDMLTVNGGKIYGPKQAGALYVRAGLVLIPQILGGNQQKLRSGTENPAAAVGLAAAMELAYQNRKKDNEKLGDLQSYFFSLLKEKFPSAKINGSIKKRLPNNIHITLPGSDNERLINALDERGIMVAAGSACSASNEEPSHALRSMGMKDEDIRASLRITMGKSTSKKDLDYLLKSLQKIL